MIGIFLAFLSLYPARYRVQLNLIVWRPKKGVTQSGLRKGKFARKTLAFHLHARPDENYAIDIPDFSLLSLSTRRWYVIAQ